MISLSLSLGLKPTFGHTFANAIHQGFFGTFLESSLGGFCLGPRGVIFQLQFGGASVHRKHQTSWMARNWKIECDEFRQNCWQTHKLISYVKRRSFTEQKCLVLLCITVAIFKTALDLWWNITPLSAAPSLGPTWRCFVVPAVATRDLWKVQLYGQSLKELPSWLLMTYETKLAKSRTWHIIWKYGIPE